MQHTPGPWKHVGLPGGWDGVASEQDGLICKLVYNNPANASLIAEAPALKARVDWLEANIAQAVRLIRPACQFNDEPWLTASELIAVARMVLATLATDALAERKEPT